MANSFKRYWRYAYNLVGFRNCAQIFLEGYCIPSVFKKKVLKSRLRISQVANNINEG